MKEYNAAYLKGQEHAIDNLSRTYCPYQPDGESYQLYHQGYDNQLAFMNQRTSAENDTLLKGLFILAIIIGITYLLTR